MEKEMQDKLEEYRLRKRRKQVFDDIKSKFRAFMMLGTGQNDETEGPKLATTIQIVKEKSDVDSLTSLAEDEEDLALSTDEEQKSVEDTPSNDLTLELQNENKLFKYTLWTVYFLFWITLYIIAIELKFGLVFLMFSALFGIYFNTRTGPRNRNEISAYSVFNKNCESIDGTLKAEQFEREMRYGAGSVK